MEATILEIITQVGFPIAACVGLFVLYDRSLKGFTETLTQIKTMIEDLSGFINSLDKKINSNTEEG